MEPVPGAGASESVQSTRCRNCGSLLHAGDRFCERCGTQLTEEEPPGARRAGDRVELDLGVAAAVSDRGLVHSRNEDSFFLEVLASGIVAAVVCDGVSSASAGNVAARSAAETAGAILQEAGTDWDGDSSALTVKAIEAASDAVAEVPWTTRTRRVDPSCTLVSALCRAGEIVIGWAGDSRAYWIDAGDTRQLTVDDSFAEEGIAAGALTAEQAARSPFLHAITNWVGTTAPARPPRMVTVRPDGPGRLVLCTDGMWNYAATTDALRELVDTVPDESSPVAVARALTDAALMQGGSDNITVAVVNIRPS
jgi:PPM family protein phosphatase